MSAEAKVTITRLGWRRWQWHVRTPRSQLSGICPSQVKAEACGYAVAYHTPEPLTIDWSEITHLDPP